MQSKNNKVLKWWEWSNLRVRQKDPISVKLYEEYKKRALAVTNAPIVTIASTNQDITKVGE